MSARDRLRTLTPLGWSVLLVMAVVLVAIAGRGLGLSWDPLGLQQRRLDTALARATLAETEAEARRVEAEGREEQAVQLEIHHRQTLAVERATVAAVAHARSAEDAHDPLDPVRAERLRDHDGELCRLAPDLDGCAAASDPA